MIEIIEGFPGNVVGLAAKGEVTRKDYLEVVIPAIDKALKRNAKLRLYYDLGSQFTGIDFGAEWEDFKLGIEHLSRWERVAVVTDVRLDQASGRRFSLSYSRRSTSLHDRPDIGGPEMDRRAIAPMPIRVQRRSNDSR